MSCKDCDKIKEEEGIIYYRWKNANIGIIACSGHGREILEVLNDYQEKVRKAEKFRELIKDPKQNEPN